MNELKFCFVLFCFDILLLCFIVRYFCCVIQLRFATPLNILNISHEYHVQVDERRRMRVCNFVFIRIVQAFRLNDNNNNKNNNKVGFPFNQWVCPVSC